MNFSDRLSVVQEKADVSAIAGTIRLIGLAQPNHIFAYCNAEGVVLNAGRSAGTIANSPAWNEQLSPDYLNRNAADHGEILAGSSCLYWWRLANAVTMSPMEEPRGWREILNDILDDLQHLYPNRHHVQQSINGVIGATNSRTRDNSPEELLAALMQRFDSKSVGGGIFSELACHPKWRDFLVQRVRALRS